MSSSSGWQEESRFGSSGPCSRPTPPSLPEGHPRPSAPDSRRSRAWQLPDQPKVPPPTVEVRAEEHLAQLEAFEAALGAADVAPVHGWRDTLPVARRSAWRRSAWRRPGRLYFQTGILRACPDGPGRSLPGGPRDGPARTADASLWERYREARHPPRPAAPQCWAPSRARVGARRARRSAWCESTASPRRWAPPGSPAAVCDGVPTRLTTRRTVPPGARSAKQRRCSGGGPGEMTDRVGVCWRLLAS
jgi:hypothetical protein